MTPRHEVREGREEMTLRPKMDTNTFQRTSHITAQA